jgi:hypothetical protein
MADQHVSLPSARIILNWLSLSEIVHTCTSVCVLNCIRDVSFPVKPFLAAHLPLQHPRHPTWTKLTAMLFTSAPSGDFSLLMLSSGPAQASPTRPPRANIREANRMALSICVGVLPRGRLEKIKKGKKGKRESN